MKGVEPLRLLNECPTVVGIMTATIGSGGSIDTAVREVAAKGPPQSRRVFTDVVRMVDSKGSPDVQTSLRDAVSTIPERASGYRRAVLMCLTASESSDRDERARLINDASDTALNAVKDMGESYSASLTIPCMVVFGLGIMAPMVLMSILPILGMGDMFGSIPIDGGIITTVVLLVIPSAITMMVVTIRSKNPFITGKTSLHDFRHCIPMLIAIPLSAVHLSGGGDPGGLFLFAITPAAMVTVILMIGDMMDDRRRTREAMVVRDSVFDIGNRMMGGENLESASVNSLRCRRGSTVGMSVSRELALCRGDVGGALQRSLEPVSEEMSSAMVNVFRCSEEDLTDAGRLAVTLGRQFQNIDSTRKGLELKLKSMTDMMVGTSMLFAPLVLGLSLSMLEPLSGMSGYDVSGATEEVLGLYLVELSALISVLTCSLGTDGGVRGMLFRFCLMCPVSLLAFSICSSVML